MLLLILLCLTILVFYALLRRRYGYWNQHGVPFPKPTLIFGNTWKAISLKLSLGDVLKNIYNNYEHHSYVGFFNLWQPALLVRDPELIKNILVNEFNKFPNNWIEVSKHVDPILGQNPFILQNNQWKVVRKQLNPQFTNAKIKPMFCLLEDVCARMVEYIENQIKSNNSKKIETKDLCARFTGEAVFTCAYGLNGKSFEVKVPDPFKICLTMSSSSFIILFKQNISMFLPSVQKILNCTFLGEPVPKLFETIILEAIRFREENNIERMDFLGFLKNLKAHSPPVSDALLVCHAFSFFFDGFQTCAIIFAQALLELALNPAIQSTAREHIKTILKNYNGEMSYQALQEMKYIDNIILETVRKYSPLNFLSRVCKEEFAFPPAEGSQNDFIVEKGTQIFISATGVHMDPKYYPNPHRFNPENFNEEAVDARPSYTFLGFGDGPKMCLGRKFAMAQLKMGLATILNKYNLEENEKNPSLDVHISEIYTIFSSPENDILLDFHPLV